MQQQTSLHPYVEMEVNSKLTDCKLLSAMAYKRTLEGIHHTRPCGEAQRVARPRGGECKMLQQE